MTNGNQKTSVKRRPTMFIALLPILIMLVVVGVGFSVLKLPLDMVLLISGIAAAIIAKSLGYTWGEVQDAIAEKIGKSTPAIFILLAVGVMVGSWIAAGTLPMMIYYGIQIISPKLLYATAFIVGAIVSVFSGTSYGSAASMGVISVSIAGALGMSLPITAGAALSGAYFGDKLSPLSDTTVLAATVTDTNLFEHIRHMLWTTIPASIVGLVVYLIAGFNTNVGAVDMESVNVLLQQLSQIFNWNILLLLPLVIILVGTAMKYQTAPVMILSSAVAVVLAMTVQNFSFATVMTACAKGFNVSMVTVEGFDPAAVAPALLRLLNRGGMGGMMSLVLIVYCAYIFGGAVGCTGSLDVLMEKLLSKVKTTGGLVASTVASSLIMSFVAGISYLSILVTGELFKDAYKARGLASCNLSRTLEDSGTVVTALIPWTGGAVFMAGTLGVPTLEYLPWAVMNYTGFIFALIWAYTGIGIKKLPPENGTLAESKKAV